MMVPVQRMMLFGGDIIDTKGVVRNMYMDFGKIVMKRI